MRVPQLFDQRFHRVVRECSAIQPHLGNASIEEPRGILAATEHHIRGIAADIEKLRPLTAGDVRHAIDIHGHVSIQARRIARDLRAIPRSDDDMPLAVLNRAR